MELIFNEKDETLQQVDEIVRKCRTDIYIQKGLYGIKAGALCYLEKETNNILVLFREDQFPININDSNSYEADYSTAFKASLSNSGFKIIEEQVFEPGKFLEKIQFKTHLFKLKKQ